ncbi:hypothetical protein [Nocardia araoensis]|uniref:hypothetical protein n=1 Tax=Nocardia araoensis TaxID=228600 RepID=UPI0012F65419|nr:hypothetical protein [Nocardia araoensis]
MLDEARGFNWDRFPGLADLRAETLQTLLEPIANGFPPLVQRDDIGDRHRLHALIET